MAMITSDITVSKTEAGGGGILATQGGVAGVGEGPQDEATEGAQAFSFKGWNENGPMTRKIISLSLIHISEPTRPY